MSFTDYWKEKAQKRRKSWAAKAKRFAEHHTQLEDIRMEVFLPIDYTAGFDLDDYKVLHYTKKNPIVDWQSGWSFAFSEDNLRQAMGAEGADMSSFDLYGCADMQADIRSGDDDYPSLCDRRYSFCLLRSDSLRTVG